VNGDPWAVLGLEPGASQDEVRHAWRVAAARLHPDRGGDPDAFRVAKAAYEFLSALPDRAQSPGGGLGDSPPCPPEPPPGDSPPCSPEPPPGYYKGGRGFTGDDDPEAGPTVTVYASSRLTLGQWLCPYGVGSLVRHALGWPAWLFNRSAFWAARQIADNDGAPLCIRDVLAPLWLWLWLTPLVGLAWLVTALAANAVEPSGVPAFVLAVVVGTWWALVGLRVVTRVGSAARTWWASATRWRQQNRELRRSARANHRLQRRRARWGY